MKKRLFTMFLFLTALCGVCAGNSFHVMFYNTENLFDTDDDPLVNDDEFTPSGSRRWSRKRYLSKLDGLSKVVVAVCEDGAPDVVGLCEVENDTVLSDLTRRSALKELGYRYVMTNSPDKRGIDVALMYNRFTFSLISCESLRVSLAPESKSTTRDILHVTGRTVTADTLDLYVCHWPSRIGGTEQTEHLRSKAAAVVKASVQSVLETRRRPYIIIMGDLNESYRDYAVRHTLSTLPYSERESAEDGDLVTLMDPLPRGTYRYQGEWDCYDQFIINGSFLNGNGFMNHERTTVCELEFLLEEDNEYGGYKPLRTYNGYKYRNGYSDHLPILLKLSY